MSLNKSTGNMYEFITHTRNTVKGKCYHDCSYCYMKRWGKQNPIRFDEKELKTDLGSGNFIFVGSSNDMFAENIPNEWINKTLEHCNLFDNRYLFQTKNPGRLLKFINHPVIRNKSVACTTIESNRFYKDIMRNSPEPIDRALMMGMIGNFIPTYVTIEPIITFDLEEISRLIKVCKPEQVNIGADSGKNQLPEPSKEKVLELINELEKFTTIHNKKNLSRLM